MLLCVVTCDALPTFLLPTCLRLDDVGAYLCAVSRGTFRNSFIGASQIGLCRGLLLLLLYAYSCCLLQPYIRDADEDPTLPGREEGVYVLLCLAKSNLHCAPIALRTSRTLFMPSGVYM